jgi:putative sterol carrier protein
MVPGPGEDSFQPHWLVVALESLMQGRKARRSTTVGVEVDNTILTVQVDKRTTHVAIAGDRQPDTVFRAEPSVVLGLAAGMLTIEQATALGELRGNKADLQAVFDRR